MQTTGAEGRRRAIVQAGEKRDAHKDITSIEREKVQPGC